MPRRAEADLKVAGRGDASCTRTRRDNSRPLARESSDPIEEDKRGRSQRSSSRSRRMLQQEHHLPHPDDDDEARVPREKHKVKANLTHWVAAITQNNSHARGTRLTPHK